jgi:putative endopeptidase
MLRVLQRGSVLAIGIAVGVSAASSQQRPEAQPLSAMPYSPSFDVTNLDRTVDPCVDFYKFSCGGWQAKNPIPADQAGWSVYAKLGDENTQFLWGILKEDAAMKQRTPVQQKVGDFFNACMDTAAIDRRGEEPIADGMKRLAALPDRAAVVVALARLHHLSSGSYFFRSGPEQDPDDSSKILVTVNASGLGLPDRDYYLKQDAKSVETRAKYADYIAKLLVLSGETSEQASSDATGVLKIETALAKASLSRVDRRDPYKTFHKMTVTQLSATDSVIDWAKYFAVQGVPELVTLNVAQPEFQKAVDVELTTEPLEALKAYLRFHLVANAAPALSTAFVTADFDFNRGYLRGAKEQPLRWKTCVHGADRQLGEALGQEFVARTFTADTKSKTLLMTGQIEAQMQVEIEHLDWMSDATKKEALRKLHAVRNKVGYPDHWRDYSSLTVKPDDYFGDVERALQFERAREWAKVAKPVDRDEWGMTPPTVNAYFNPQMNDINFPAGVLQPPLYDPKLDDAPNYGNTGATIGHELTHGFDDEGRRFDAQGNLKDWWTQDDAKNFEDRINCVRDQYARYVIVDDIHINSKLTSGEDVADLGGTLVAYMAWKKATETQRLKEVDGFSPDQRFFVGMAQWACENARPENERVQALTDPHSPGFARINGVVSNMPEFANAFSCKAGQPMVHARACKVW